MICKVCEASYTTMTGVQRFKKDYGYCSVECVILSKPPCPNCGKPVLRREGEKLYAFIARDACSQMCGASFFASQKRSDETRQRMSEAAKLRPPEQIDKATKARAKFYAGEGGGLASVRTVEGHKAWRVAYPDQVANMVRKQNITREERGVYEKTSKRLIAFYQTPEGEKRKEKYRAERIGKPRSLIVTQKMKAGMRLFWDSEEGFKTREDISYKRSEGLDQTPYGPGWNQKSAAIRQRDGHCCVICGATKEIANRSLDVHHIYRKNRFGYVPGMNRNYIWANHSANLITLCPACHMRVELGVVGVPDTYQAQADQLWREFTAS